MQVFKALTNAHPQVFTRPVIYDSKKNLFATYELPLGDTDSEEVVMFTVDSSASYRVVSSPSTSRMRGRRLPSAHPENLKYALPKCKKSISSSFSFAFSVTWFKPWALRQVSRPLCQPATAPRQQSSCRNHGKSWIAFTFVQYLTHSK
jgi:hypothetical protein